MTTPRTPGQAITLTGLVVPIANVRLVDSPREQWTAAWRDHLCGECEHRLAVPMVLLGGPNHLRQLLFEEPAMHPACADRATHEDRAEPWYAVYVRWYRPAARPDHTIIGGLCTPRDVIRVRKISDPGVVHNPWQPVTDWATNYQAPEVREP